MLNFKVGLASTIMTFVFFMGGIGMETAYGQSSQPYANCIFIFYEGDSVQLAEDEDCDSKQFAEAVTYYKANGYPHEESYSDFGFGKTMQLHSEKFLQDLKDLGMD